ncbi:MAG TPA: YqhA family protein, partial [Dermatophilaceae bacterium]|nr:YqhA family protein [Dermatophilaceae bacterium]
LDIDLFLIGATMLISAVGFYELFIQEIRQGSATPVPTWLQMADLNDLKGRVIAMVVLVASVSFVEVVVDAPSGRQALQLGIGIASVIVALSLFLYLGSRGERG